MTSPANALLLENRHTGERLELHRVAQDGQTWLVLRGTLPPHREGPPMHVHYHQVEEGHVLAGTLSIMVDGKQGQVGPGGGATFAAGAAHRWWNAGDETLRFEGLCKPAGDLDRYLQAVFEVLNSGQANRPSLFYMAHVSWRHRRTQAVILLPRPIQAVLFPLIVLVGSLTGRYRGTEWPGAPARCRDAPLGIEL